MIGVIGEELTAMFLRHGRLTAAIVVQESTAADSPLHGMFTWDDAEAAHAHRLDQARRLIRSVRIRVREGDPASDSIRAFVHVPAPSEPAPNLDSEDPDPVDAGYLPTVDVGQSSRLKAIALGQMEREWRLFRRRWERYAEFWDVVGGAGGQRSA